MPSSTAPRKTVPTYTGSEPRWTEPVTCSDARSSGEQQVGDDVLAVGQGVVAVEAQQGPAQREQRGAAGQAMADRASGQPNPLQPREVERGPGVRAGQRVGVRARTRRSSSGRADAEHQAGQRRAARPGRGRARRPHAPSWLDARLRGRTRPTRPGTSTRPSARSRAVITARTGGSTSEPWSDPTTKASATLSLAAKPSMRRDAGHRGRGQRGHHAQRGHRAAETGELAQVAGAGGSGR